MWHVLTHTHFVQCTLARVTHQTKQERYIWAMRWCCLLVRFWGTMFPMFIHVFYMNLPFLPDIFHFFFLQSTTTRRKMNNDVRKEVAEEKETNTHAHAETRKIRKSNSLYSINVLRNSSVNNNNVD